MTKTVTICAVLASLLILLFVGTSCSELSPANIQARLRGEDPLKRPQRPLDYDNDGLTDFSVYCDGNTGVPLEGPDGDVIVVPNSKGYYDQLKMARLTELQDANDADKLVGSELTLWGNIMPPGIGIVLTGIGGFLLRHGVAKRLVKYKHHIENIVGAFEEYKENVTPGTWKKVATNMGDMSEDTRDLVDIVINKRKAEIAAEIAAENGAE